uniref:Uncharacterized protein n=1 Tax=Tetranychus urticae TaxID=32264 RepID=T1K9B9_TETUR
MCAFRYINLSSSLSLTVIVEKLKDSLDGLDFNGKEKKMNQIKNSII